MNWKKLSSYGFFGTILSLLVCWSYFPSVLLHDATMPAFAGVALASLIGWIFFGLEDIIQWTKKRSGQYWIGMVITAVSLILALGAVNYASVELFNRKWDWTSNKLNSLSTQTVSVLQKIPQDEELEVRVWSMNIERMAPNIGMVRFLDSYKIASKGKLSWVHLNPIKDPLQAQQDKITRDNVVIVRSKKSQRETRIENFNDSKGEEQLTNAIAQVNKTSQKKMVCVLTGHGEMSLNENAGNGLGLFRELAESSNYEAKEMDIVSQTISSDCEILVSVGPRGAPLGNTVKMISDYLAGGGALLAFWGALTPVEWGAIVLPYGIKLNQDIVIDPRYQGEAAVTNSFEPGVDIVKGLQGVVFREARSLEVSGDAKKIVSSMPYTWTKVGDVSKLKDANKRPGDKAGPHVMGAMVVKPVAKSDGSSSVWPDFGLISRAYAQEGHDHSGHNHGGHDHGEDGDHGHDHGGVSAEVADSAKDEVREEVKETRVIVFGSGWAAANMDINQGSNRDLVMNSVSSVLKDQDLIGIRPRDVSKASLELTPERLNGVVGTIIILTVLLIAGAWIARSRRLASA